MLKILEVSTLFPRWKGDSRGPIIYQIAQNLQALGHKVSIVNMHGPGSLSYEIIDGIEIFRPRYFWPTRCEILQNTGGGLPSAWEKYPLSRLLFPPLLIAQAIAILRLAEDYDIIHAHFTLPAMAATLGKPIHQKPIVATVRGSDIYRIPKYPFGRLFNQVALSGCEKITVMSHDLGEATKELGIPSFKFEYTPPPINIERFSDFPWEQRKPQIVYIASLIPRKGPDVLLKAFQKAVKQIPQFKLIMVGSGPMEQELKLFASENGLSDQVEFIPILSQEDVAKLLQTSKLFVLPSYEEALGMVVVEALASGTPVIASRVGGIPEAVSPDNSVLVNPGDSNELADAMIRLLVDEDELIQRNRSARPWVEEHFYSHQQNALHLQRIFLDLTRNDNQ
jgi:glycosyltransferase involved in cell wall biosynthesis